MIRYVLFISILSLSVLHSNAQELKCTVEIEYSKTQSTDPKVFETLRTSVAEFMNNRKWTNDVFSDEERIECTLFINIDQELSANEFAGQLIIQSERPVFNSTYKTVVFSNKDDNFKIEYNQFDNLEFSDNTYFSNLTSMLGFYAYMIIAFDYESFSPNGGTQYFLKAQDVVNSIPGGARAKYQGWSTFDGSRNRAILIAAIQNPRYAKYRDIIHEFHFLGLDNMYDNVEKSRKVITDLLVELKKLYDDNPSSMLVKIFFLAKSDELISLYSMASKAEKTQVLELISSMDASNIIKYKELTK